MKRAIIHFKDGRIDDWINPVASENDIAETSTHYHIEASSGYVYVYDRAEVESVELVEVSA